MKGDRSRSHAGATHGARLEPGAGWAELGLLKPPGYAAPGSAPVHGRTGLACGVQKRWSQEQGPDDPCSFFLRLGRPPSEPQVKPDRDSTGFPEMVPETPSWPQPPRQRQGPPTQVAVEGTVASCPG